MADQIQLAERIRDACVRAALAAYEDAGIRGLCQEGRWEMAIQAMRALDLESILDQSDQELKP